LADRGSYWLSYAPLMLIFTRKIGQSVQASDATVVGRLRDLTARLGAEHPTVHRLAIGSRRHVTALMPLWMSSSGQLRFRWGCDDPIDFAGDVSLEAADGFAVGFAFGDAAGEVVAGTGVPPQPA
jgi:hypothetical protein